MTPSLTQMIADNPDWIKKRRGKMANGTCDICGRPATARVRASVNGRVQNMELCDQHYSKTMGPERAMRMDACGSAVRHGIPFAFHSDCGITPINPLFTGWCAVNRLTASGRVLGEAE